MQVKRYEEYGTVILPKVVDLTNAPEFKHALESLYEEGNRKVLVDCSQLEMIDSAGLGSLVIYQKRLQERSGELAIINVSNDYIKRLFEMIDLKRVIQIEQT